VDSQRSLGASWSLLPVEIDHLRQTYRMGSLDESTVNRHPIPLLQEWFQQAIASQPAPWLEVNAMSLSTCGDDGRITSRIVLLKGIGVDGLTFFTNYQSEKGVQLHAHPQAALLIYWPHLERQVRVEGTVCKTDRLTSETYFASRPRSSQLGALVSQQSTPIASRALMEQRLEQLQSQYADGPIPCPEHWGGYRLAPDRIEFWQGRDSRLHDRIDYRWQHGNWVIQRLSP
jgi:pyridoxamine 5'-phosphate oxidase